VTRDLWVPDSADLTVPADNMPKRSPDGRREAYINNFNVVVRPAGGGPVTIGDHRRWRRRTTAQLPGDPLWGGKSSQGGKTEPEGSKEGDWKYTGVVRGAKNGNPGYYQHSQDAEAHQ